MCQTSQSLTYICSPVNWVSSWWWAAISCCEVGISSSVSRWETCCWSWCYIQTAINGRGIGLCLLKSVPVFLRTLVPSQKLLLLLSNTPRAFLLGNETSLFGLFSPLLFFLFSPRANCSDCRGIYSGHFVWRAEDAERTPYLTWSEAFQESHREQHK